MKKILVFMLFLCMSVGLAGCSSAEAAIGITIVLALAVHIGFALAFAANASAKGHSFGGYFCVCFFFGIIGYILVAALPDSQVSPDSIYRLEKKIDKLAEELKMHNKTISKDTYNPAGTTNVNTGHRSEAITPKTAGSGTWICNNCETENKNSYGQCKKCGLYRQHNA